MIQSLKKDYIFLFDMSMRQALWKRGDLELMAMKSLNKLPSAPELKLYHQKSYPERSLVGIIHLQRYSRRILQSKPSGLSVFCEKNFY